MGHRREKTRDDERLNDDRGLYRHVLPGGWEVLAGRTDGDNERLSLKLARANDYWFHVRGQPGSHVILRVPDQLEPDRTVLKAAAAVAAYYSKARAGGVTAVSCTRARFVSKARGSPRGTVSIRREVVIKVRPALPVDQEELP